MSLAAPGPGGYRGNPGASQRTQFTDFYLFRQTFCADLPQPHSAPPQLIPMLAVIGTTQFS